LSFLRSSIVRHCGGREKRGSLTHRVVLWGPGQVGVGALRALIQHPGLALAGVIVHSKEKVGQDAGDLCGLPPTGIIATDSIDEALSVDAEAVAYFASGDYRYREAAGDIARALRAGKNVVSTSLVPLCFPPRADADVVALLEDACKRGGTSLFNSGVDPGWVNDLVPLIFSGFCTHIESITMLEILDYSEINQPDIMYDFMGFAAPPEATPPLLEPGRLLSLWSPVVYGLADGLGLRLDEVTDSVERWITPDDYETASGPIRAGTMGALRFRLTGHLEGEERIVLEHITRMGEHSAPEWPRHSSPLGGYRIVLEGMPTYTVDIEMHGRGNNLRGLTYATVMREINAIPAVINARPGILSTRDLPIITGPMRGATWTGLL
jgi:2,4-diaminopentanoate dehydrogenase